MYAVLPGIPYKHPQDRGVPALEPNHHNLQGLLLQLHSGGGISISKSFVNVLRFSLGSKSSWGQTGTAVAIAAWPCVVQICQNAQIFWLHGKNTLLVYTAFSETVVTNFV